MADTKDALGRRLLPGAAADAGGLCRSVSEMPHFR